MKKLFIILSAVVALAACSKSEIAEIKETKQEETVSTPVTFNITVNEAGTTKALKTAWANGDVIYIKFKGIDTKYLTITYNGSSWIPQGYTLNDDPNTTDFDATDFSGDDAAADRKLGAVHYPSSVAVTPKRTNLSTTYFLGLQNNGNYVYAYYLFESEADYTFDGTNVNVTLSLKKPDNVVLFHIPGIQANASDYSLTISGEGTQTRRCTTRGIQFGGKVTQTQDGNSNLAAVGFPDADGALFTFMLYSGFTADKELTFTVVGLDNEFRKTLTTTLTAGYQYNLPALSSEKWTPKISFTADADGKKVRFAPGNLQATAKGKGWNQFEYSWTWNFAAHQYDFIGDAKANNAIANVMELSEEGANGTVDLFARVGKDAQGGDINNGYWCYGITHFYVTQESWNQSTEGRYYYGTADQDIVDWGTLPIGSYPAGTWRTPTYEELKYIIFERTCTSANLPAGTNSEAARYVFAKVCGINGLIVFPDVYNHPDGITVTSKEGHNPYYNSQKYYNGNEDLVAVDYADFEVADQSDWEKMEAAGAVFLPAAGSRNGSTVYTTTANGDYGSYWVSSPSIYEDGYAKSFSFNTTLHSFRMSTDADIWYGRSVRLVRDM